MKHLKKTLGAVLVTMMMTGMAFADQIGVVDMRELSQKYSKAQALSAQVKTRDEELQRMREDFLKQLKAADKASPVEKKNLEDKLTAQLNAKFKEHRDWMITQEQALRVEVDKAINSVAAAQKLDIVLPRENVIHGGKDITNEVLTTLGQ